MQTHRYQQGSLTLMKRKGQAVSEFPKRKDAERALMHVRVNINEGAAYAPMTIEDLAAHYLSHEVPDKAYSTRENYKNVIKNQVVPKWGNSSLSSILAIEVENWLKALKRRDGKPASPGSKAKIRNVISAMYSHAIRYGWATNNPIRAVRTSSKRLKEPKFLTAEEFCELVRRLDQRERVIVLLDGSTAIRRESCSAFAGVTLILNRSL